METKDKKRKTEEKPKKTIKRKKNQKLQDFNGIHGILFTCRDSRESEAKREAFTLIEEVFIQN